MFEREIRVMLVEESADIGPQMWLNSRCAKTSK